MRTKVSDLEKLEDLIFNYKHETDTKKKHVVYLNLVEESLKLVKRIVMNFHPLPLTITKDDLIQVGALGVLGAIEAYRVEERGSFKTYVSKVIKGKIFHYLRDKANIVKPPRQTVENLSKVKDAIEKLTENSDTVPTASDIAKIVNLPEDKVEEIMNLELLKNMVSLDQSVYTSEGSETLIDRLQSGDSNSFEEMYENKKIIENAINKLALSDKIAISMYYIEGESRKDIAKCLNVSQTQVSRILKRALNKLYIIMRDELPEGMYI